MDGGDARASLPRPTMIEVAVVGVLTLLGLRLGLRAISDNSMLLHLRTGVDIVRSGHIPRHDPYSFTAPGHAWVVQSWLAEVTYGVAHELGGFRAVVIEQGVLCAVLALVIALLARTGHSIGTVIAAGSSVLAGAILWAPRPFLFGLLGLALLIFVVERRRSPWWLLPVVWVWVNTHGSFPLGVAWLGATYFGSVFDTRRRPRWLEPYIGTFVLGLAISAINPLGPRLLAFPFVVQAHTKVFQLIIEWRSPNFQLGYAFVTLMALAVGLLVLLRKGAPWADVLPFVGFLVAGLIAVRNLPFAAVVLAPVLGHALRGTARPAPQPVAASVGTGTPRALPPPIVPALGIAAVALTVVALRAGPIDLSSYPTGGEAYMASHGLLTNAHRIAAADVVGNYRELVEGARQNVFIDDRYDMYPASVVNDSQTILDGQGAALAALKKWNIDVLVAKKGTGSTGLLHAVGGWRTVWSDAHWEIMLKDPTAPPSPPA